MNKNINTVGNPNITVVCRVISDPIFNSYLPSPIGSTFRIFYGNHFSNFHSMVWTNGLHIRWTLQLSLKPKVG